MNSAKRRALPDLQPNVEMSADRAFSRRVIRLAVAGLVAEGLIWALARATLHVGAAIEAPLFAGWLIMPALLLASLRWPRLRYGLVLPSGLVTLGLLAICLTALPANGLAAAGWLLTTAGVFLGGLLGLWFWFRLLPVPPALHAPFGRGRWLLIALHVTLILTGLSLAALGAA